MAFGFCGRLALGMFKSLRKKGNLSLSLSRMVEENVGLSLLCTQVLIMLPKCFFRTI